MPRAKDGRKRGKKKTRSARGMGSVFEHKGRGCWIARGANGKPEASGKTQAEAIARLKQKEEELKGEKPTGANPTVAEWGKEWLAHLTNRPGTKDDYDRSVRLYIAPALGPLKVADVTALDVQRAVTKWTAKLGVNTVRKVVRHTSAMFTAAVHAGKTTTNPVRVTKKPKRVKQELDVYTPAELAEVIKAAPTVAAGGVIATLAATGCRIGEALALDVLDFDPAARTIHIWQTFDRRYGIGPTKTDESIRTIEAPADLLPILRAAAAKRTSGPLFQTSRGKRQTHAAVWTAWQSLAENIGLPAKKPHAFRHSVATMLIAAGRPISEIAEYLGDTPETIVNTYLKKTKASPVGTINELLSGLKVGAGKKGAKKTPSTKGK
ncbi:MAG: site-specific integrase [Gemmataceae bacterium]|nr:site-specific integrase [Gemmataceae bacterium]